MCYWLFPTYYLTQDLKIQRWNYYFKKKGSFQQQRKFQLWLCDHIVSIDQIIPGINKYARGLAILLHILVNEFYQQCLIKIFIHNLLLLTVNFKK